MKSVLPVPDFEGATCTRHLSGHRLSRSRILVLASLLFAPALVRAQNAYYDVVIYGGSSAGVVAAVQAAQLGKSVLLIAPGRHFGGMTASGLGATDVGVAETIGGLAREFYRLVGLYYQTPAAAGSTNAVAAATVPKFEFEPHVAEAIFTTMMRGAGAHWILEQQLDRLNGVTVRGGRIVSLRMKSGRQFSAAMFVDATYEGDLLAAAGVRYRIGRESRSEYGEPLAGIVRNPDPEGEVDPHPHPQQPASGLLPGVSPHPLPPDGAGDNRVQQYNFRLCFTNVPANRVPVARPDNYDATRYELLARRLRQHPDWNLGAVCKVQPMPNGKADVNNNGPFSTDMPGDESTLWAESSDEERSELLKVYRRYTQGLLWFLANDPSVPNRIAEEARQWGFAKDEFADNDHWPWQLYVREARRMTGSYVLSQHDCQNRTVIPDPVALGSYGMVSHAVTLFVNDRGMVNTEGFFFEPVSPYPISYRAIVPRANECINLFVPICVSATHVAFNSLRMEPVFMMLGQVAGTAAALAIDRGTSVQNVPYADLARQLRADGQVLTWPSSATITRDEQAPLVLGSEAAPIRANPTGRFVPAEP